MALCGVDECVFEIVFHMQILAFQMALGDWTGGRLLLYT